MFTAVEQEVAWAASLWIAAYNARVEALCGDPPVGRDALRAQAANASAGLMPSAVGFDPMPSIVAKDSTQPAVSNPSPK